MFSVLLAAIALQTATLSLEGDVPQADIVKELAAPPTYDRARAIRCSCKDATPAMLLLEGLVVDAEVTLGPDGRSANDRQATFFNVLKAREDGKLAKVSGRTKVFHQAGSAKCGVSFDYGKRYAVPVRKTEDGELETDFCLIANALIETAAKNAQ